MERVNAAGRHGRSERYIYNQFLIKTSSVFPYSTPMRVKHERHAEGGRVDDLGLASSTCTPPLGR